MHVVTYYLNANTISLQNRHSQVVFRSGGRGGVLCMLGFSFTFDLIVSLAQAEVEVER